MGVQAVLELKKRPLTEGGRPGSAVLILVWLCLFRLHAGIFPLPFLWMPRTEANYAGVELNPSPSIW